MSLGSKGKCTRYMRQEIGNCLYVGISRKSILIGGMLILIAETGYTEYMKVTYIYSINGVLSYADCFVIQNSIESKLLYLVPIFLCSMMGVIHKDEDIQFLIRQKSRSEVWQKRFCKICLTSLLMSVYVTIIACIVSVLLADIPINWDKEGSFFWLMTKGGRLFGDMVGIGTVAVTFFSISLIEFIFIGEVFALCQWLSGNMFTGWIVCMGLGIFESFPGPKLFFKRVSIFFNEWIGGYPYMKVFFFSAAVILCIFYVGVLVAKRKEFM